MKTRVLITGANYNNKGAQSMLFIAVDELVSRIPECEIFYACDFGDELIPNANFKQLCYSFEAIDIALKNHNSIKAFLIGVAKVTKRLLTNKYKNRVCNFLQLKKNISSFDLIIDVSGFMLSNLHPLKSNEFFLNTIRLGEMYDVDVFLMPQSFGPFDYKSEYKYIIEKIKELMKYPKLVMAREEEGYRLLKRTVDSNNIILSDDLVLQHKEFNLANIFSKPVRIKTPDIINGKNIAIIPNSRCLDHGNEELILKLYDSIIPLLTGQNFNVYIFRHSGEDLPLCRKIFQRNAHNKMLKIIEDDFSCLQYDVFVRKFDFIICSRYHGIVHAYRNGIPSILLGWSLKYTTLASKVAQEKYVFDITRIGESFDDVLDEVQYMIDHYNSEKTVITDRINNIQKNNCFNYISEWNDNRTQSAND